MISKIVCKQDDCKTISELSNIIWHECYKNMLSQEQREYMLERFLNPSSIENQMNNGITFYFIYLNKELTGYFAIRDDISHIYLCKLYIMDKYRGNKIFRYILDFLDTFKKDIKLNTCQRNETLKIYLHVGFEIIDEIYNEIGNGFVMDDYILLKKYK